MSQPLNVHFLPSLMGPSTLQGGTAVIIDILRASSTIATALHNGAREVIPCGSPDAARRIRDQAQPKSVLLGGERGGVLIEGFDCGNSPAEYPDSRVAGKTVAFTTTNGTHALLQAAAADTILIGAFLNRRAIVDRLALDRSPIHLVCAGTNGAITGEDVLFAGAVVTSLLNGCEPNMPNAARWAISDCAQIACRFWLQSVGRHSDTDAERHGIESALRETQGGRNLRELGYDSDIHLCSMADSISLVPVLDRASNSIVASSKP